MTLNREEQRRSFNNWGVQRDEALLPKKDRGWGDTPKIKNPPRPGDLEI